MFLYQNFQKKGLELFSFTVTERLDTLCKEKQIITIINTFHTYFKSKCNLVCGEHILHSSHSLKPGLQTQDPDVSYSSLPGRSGFLAYFLKQLRGWLKTSLCVCHVVKSVWLALNLWIPLSFDVAELWGNVHVIQKCISYHIMSFKCIIFYDRSSLYPVQLHAKKRTRIFTII